MVTYRDYSLAGRIKAFLFGEPVPVAEDRINYPDDLEEDEVVDEEPEELEELE